jgi:hypothetical protein
VAPAKDEAKAEDADGDADEDEDEDEEVRTTHARGCVLGTISMNWLEARCFKPTQPPPPPPAAADASPKGTTCQICVHILGKSWTLKKSNMQRGLTE